jgi:hypothetical protein
MAKKGTNSPSTAANLGFEDKLFWVPQEARCSHLLAHAKQPATGKLVDDATVAIERDTKEVGCGS